MTTTMTTLYELYKEHVDEQRDELETVLKAQTLFPHCWEKIFTLMNSTIKQQATKNDHS